MASSNPHLTDSRSIIPYETQSNQGYLYCSPHDATSLLREHVHIGPNGKRKITNSKVSAGRGYGTLPRRVNICNDTIPL